MNGYSNILEIIDTENEILHQRTLSLNNIIGLGPPDTCYIIREHKPSGLRKLVARTHTKSYYHYIYGANTSSVASIAAYFRQFMDNAESKSSKLIFGCFCVYDLISKFDIRVEIQIPGNTTCYLINGNGERFEPESFHWQGGYLSTIIRAFFPIKGSAVACASFFTNIKEIDSFMEIAEKFWDKLGFVLEDFDNVRKYGVNLLFPAISKYLLIRKRYKVHQQMFKKYIEKDPLILTFVGKSSIKLQRFDEIIRLISNQIKMTPHAFPLYFTIAKAYFKRNETAQALHICQYLIELNLDVYDYWHLLILCYIKNKDYANAILCLNIAPQHTSDESIIGLEVPDDKVIIPNKVSFRATGNI